MIGPVSAVTRVDWWSYATRSHVLPHAQKIGFFSVIPDCQVGITERNCFWVVPCAHSHCFGGRRRPFLGHFCVFRTSGAHLVSKPSKKCPATSLPVAKAARRTLPQPTVFGRTWISRWDQNDRLQLPLLTYLSARSATKVVPRWSSKSGWRAFSASFAE